MSTNGAAKPSAEVSQAVGMISVQAGCNLTEAFVLLAEYAFETNCTLDDIAAAVLAGSIRFDE